MKRADFELQILPRLLPAARKEALRQLGAAPLSEEPKKKSSRQKSVLVKAPIFCSRCGSYDHREPDCQHARMVSTSFSPATGLTKIEAVTDIGIVSFAVPVRTSNEQNGSHGFWAAKSKKRNLIRQAVGEAWKAAGIVLRPAGYRVTITRLAPLVDPMNLDACLKSVIDEVAARMGVDDSSPLVEWVRQQERHPQDQPAVRVEVEELP